MNVNHRSLAITAGIVVFLSLGSLAQVYAPAAGQAGTTAMHKDSSAFVNWAKACRVTRGYQDISNTSLGLASVGDSSQATGKAMANAVVSLGDGGEATCTFENPVRNGSGFDFAVFENGFSDTFLELAFVEVSSDGVNFFRFPSHSLSDTGSQFTNAAVMDPKKLNNLAGKYRAAYGTPFDLQELAASPGLDVNGVTHIRVIDVVGSLQRAYASYDSFGNKINDPWTTAFPSGGFDLDAIGVIHENKITAISEITPGEQLGIYPNPAPGQGYVNIVSRLEISGFELLDHSGKLMYSGTGPGFTIADLKSGIYCLKVTTSNGIVIKKLIIG